MVILRFRVSLCCTLGSILSCISGFYSDLPPRVPLVPVFTGPPNYVNPGFFVAQIVFSSTATVRFQLPSPLCKDTEPLHYRPHDQRSLYCVRSTVSFIAVDNLLSCYYSFVIFLFFLCISNNHARSPVSWRTTPLRCSHRSG